MTFISNEIIADMVTEAERAIPYCPYSDYPVKASVLVRDGHNHFVYSGANYEVITFNQTMHAEHSAITAALNARLTEDVKIIEAVYVTTPNGGPPCGHCRQIIAEFAKHKDIPIFIEQPDETIKTLLLSELLPYAFESIV